MTAIDTAAEVQAAESVKSPALLGPWALMWRQFRRHKVAWVSLYIVGFIYFVALFGEFLAPSNYLDTNTRAPFAPPQGIHFFTEGEDGGRDFQLHARGLKMEIDREAMRRHFVEDPSKVIPLGFFVEGYEYKLLWLIPTNRHFFGPTDPGQRVYFFGADRLGRDILSRIIMGTRISMSIGLVGVAVSLVVGVSLGGISGLLRWLDRQCHPTADRVPAFDPDDPALDGAGGGHPARLAALAHLFRGDADRVDDRLDNAGARGARQVPVAQTRGFRHRGAA